MASVGGGSWLYRMLDDREEAHVAGVANGSLYKEGVICSLAVMMIGDMGFKVAGTPEKGITDFNGFKIQGIIRRHQSQ